MRPALSLLFSLAIAVVAAAESQAQFRLGYVDANVIVQNMPEFKAVETRVQALRQAYEDTLRMMQTELQQGVENYKKQVGGMTPESRDEAQGRLNMMQAQMGEYQNQRFGPGGLLAQIQEELLAPVRKKALEATEKIARDEKLTAVLDLSTFIYIDRKMSVNVTYKVLEYLSAQGK